MSHTVLRAKRKLRTFSSFFPAAGALLFASYLSAQVVGGTITGVVLDPGGAPVAGASVIIRNLETGNERDLRTDTSGSYAAPSVPVGRYSVSVSKEGFSSQSRSGIELVVGQSVRANIALTVGAVAETVTVAAAPPSISLSTQ